MHTLRAAYGWTDDQILDEVMLWGLDWMFNTYKTILEDRQSHYNFLYLIAPLARTPMSKEGGRSTKRYADNVKSIIESLTPWRKSALRRDMKKKGSKGQVMVMLDQGESANHPLYKDAKIMKS